MSNTAFRTTTSCAIESVTRDGRAVRTDSKDDFIQKITDAGITRRAGESSLDYWSRAADELETGQTASRLDAEGEAERRWRFAKRRYAQAVEAVDATAASYWCQAELDAKRELDELREQRTTAATIKNLDAKVTELTVAVDRVTQSIAEQRRKRELDELFEPVLVDLGLKRRDDDDEPARTQAHGRAMRQPAPVDDDE